jgi:hypothetical protein
VTGYLLDYITLSSEAKTFGSTWERFIAAARFIGGIGFGSCDLSDGGMGIK